VRGFGATSIATSRKSAVRWPLRPRCRGPRYPAHPRVRSILALTTAAVLTLAGCSLSGVESGSQGPSATPGSTTPSDPPPSPQGEAEPLRLVTLGDGYTAGTDTGTARRDSWPAQLALAMDHGDLRLRLVDNLAESGHTSADVERVQLPQVAALEPDVVTLQVGVNDIIARDISLEDYRVHLARILDALLAIVPPDHVFLITTPDHTLTVRGGDYGPRDAGRADVQEANAILSTLAAERGIPVIDISAVNERVVDDPSLVVDEGPYPSAKQYAGWVEVIGPRMRRVLLGAEP
jgi:lysophospholipase L1-like esterase